MSSALLFVARLAQSRWSDGVPPQNRRAAAALQQVLHFSQSSDDDAAKRAAIYRQFRFTSSFNHLKKVLDEFADEYNYGALDLKKIEEIKRPGTSSKIANPSSG
jgi:hypothetical protein